MRHSIAQEIFEEVRKKVVEGKLAPCQKLIERDLQEEFQASNSPVREAIRMLCAAGIAEVIFNKGAVIVDYRDTRRRKDAYEGRVALESFCAIKLAAEGNADKINKLENALLAVEKVVTSSKVDLAELFKVEEKFHQQIIDLAGNEEIARIYRELYLFSRSSADHFTINEEAIAHTISSHRKILDAIKLNDSTKLTSLFKEHFDVIH